MCQPCGQSFVQRGQHGRIAQVAVATGGRWSRHRPFAEYARRVSTAATSSMSLMWLPHDSQAVASFQAGVRIMLLSFLANLTSFLLWSKLCPSRQLWDVFIRHRDFLHFNLRFDLRWVLAVAVDQVDDAARRIEWARKGHHDARQGLTTNYLSLGHPG